MNDKINLDADPATDVVDENHIIAERREKLAKLRAGGIAFPNDFIPTHLAVDLHDHYDSLTKEELAAKKSANLEEEALDDEVEILGSSCGSSGSKAFTSIATTPRLEIH